MTDNKESFGKKKCIPCEGGVTPTTVEEAKNILSSFDGWKLVGENAIVKKWKFKDFKEAIVFINKVADIADREDHHPDIFNSYSTVRITLSTHAIGGLSDNDFVVAAKIDEL